MREIKFRGQRVDNGQWIYGYYVYRPDGKHFIWFINISYEVHPETVGQFTGLQDKNGVDIYEGDLVEGVEKNGYGKNVKRKYQVSFVKCCFMLILIESKYDIIHPKSMKTHIKIKIIGNIHENTQP